jgi:hypothetical protein
MEKEEPKEILDNPIQQIPLSELVKDTDIQLTKVLVNPTLSGRQKRFNEGIGFFGSSDGRFSIKTSNGDYITSDPVNGIQFHGTTVP